MGCYYWQVPIYGQLQDEIHTWLAKQSISYSLRWSQPESPMDLPPPEDGSLMIRFRTASAQALWTLTWL